MATQWRVVCELDVWADTEAAAFDAARADLKRLADGPLVLTLWPEGGRRRVLDSTGAAARLPRSGAVKLGLSKCVDCGAPGYCLVDGKWCRQCADDQDCAAATLDGARSPKA